ncbi:MAG TPA: alanine-zipper protein [Micromonospora sp.]|nr:alanine-zipper protein [Micromonospora sp.]
MEPNGGLSVTLDVSAWLAAGAALVVVLGGLSAGYVSLRRWIQRVAHPARQAAEQLRTSTPGTTVADLVEGLSADVETLKRQAITNHSLATTAKDVASSALALATTANERAAGAFALAQNASERLDRHLTEHE